MENCDKLINAIIISALKDYAAAYRYTLYEPTNKYAKEELSKQEKFFYSDWYETLTDLNADVLLKETRRQEDEKFKKMKEGKKRGKANNKISKRTDDL